MPAVEDRLPAFRKAVRRRLLLHAIAFGVVWPLASALAATLDLKSQTATARLPLTDTFLLLLRAESQLFSEFLWIGAAATVITVLVAAAIERLSSPKPAPGRLLSLLAEPILLGMACLPGIALVYPAILSHPFLRSLAVLSVFSATVLLAILVLLLGALMGLKTGSGRAAALWCAATAAAVAGAWLVAASPARGLGRQAGTDSAILLGIDSLSSLEETSDLRSWTGSVGGEWYPNAVSPGLLTNSVWTAILMHRPVRNTGIWEIFQSADWTRAPFNLVRKAHRSGYTTYSYFSDQFTTYAGTEAGFDVDRSGPMGWLQLATATLKNGSAFLPAILPKLPRLPGAKTPANQSGTYGFDVLLELESILATRAEHGPAFAAGHLDYLHQPLYPRFDELTPAERAVVRGSKVASIQDFSIDWQYPAIPDDELHLYGWKIRHVQQLVGRAVLATNFLDPKKRNRLILFSDHGNRKDLTEETFWKASYWRVVLATFGVPPRPAERPISLLDAGELMGLEDPRWPGPAPPSVQFAGINQAESSRLSNAVFVLDGRVIPDPRVMREIGLRLKEYRPFSRPGLVFRTPAE